MVLVIDNYDSFTYNLVQYLGELCLGAADSELVVRRNDKISLSEIEAFAPGSIVISPGPGRPEDAGVSVDLIRRFTGEIPILGVCLGHQAIAAAFGGQIVSAGELVHGKASLIYHDGKGIFSGIPDPFPATRYHSLMVERASLPECLEISAQTDRGAIMGIRHREFAVEGVQFHPESILTSVGKSILSNFLEMSRSCVERHSEDASR
jgi:anthranilate synthase/aminodeoxychorismate synthase-like glutamine amidotransferase